MLLSTSPNIPLFVMHLRSALFLAGIFGPQICHGALPAGSTVLRFDFLPIFSETAYGTYVHGGNPDRRGSEAPCRDVYQQYLAAREARNYDGDDNMFQLIYATSDCILDSLSSMEAQTLSSAAVLLGLIPVLFATLGPSLSELGLISLQRPFLAVLFSVGSVVMLPSRVLSFYDDEPKDILKRPAGLGQSANKWLRRRGSSGRTWTYFAVGIVEYAIALVAAFNILYTSWQLGVASIFVLSSTYVHYPLVWNLIPLVTHGVVAASFHIVSRVRRGASSKHVPDEIELRQPLSPHTSSFPTNRNPSSVDVDADYAQHSRWTLQFLPSCSHPPIRTVTVERHWLTEVAHNVATVGSFAQILYGTVVFSSLLFVAAADVAIIMLRYAASVFVCRLLIAFEIGGMRLEDENKVQFTTAVMDGDDIQTGKR